jgi:peptidoglycan-associated lipoprotein
MRIRYSLYLILSVALLAGGGCASGKWPWSRKPKTDANTVIQPNLIDEQTGAEISSHGTGAFDETRERVTDVEFAPVYFGFDSYSLAPIEVAKIENVARYLLSNNGRVLVVEGHCDERGSNEYNLSLGEQRANTVRSYIVNLGVSSDRVQTRSYGEEKPAATGHDEASWRLNRRGEFAIYR